MEKMIRTALVALLIAAPLAVTAQTVHGGNGQSGGQQGGNGQGGGKHGGNGQSGGQQGGNGQGGGLHGGNNVRTGTLSAVGGSCGVTDLNVFAEFIAGRPTVTAFKAAYGCVHLVLPGDVASREIRSDNSRYFAEVDTFGRIVGGYFQ